MKQQCIINFHLKDEIETNQTYIIEIRTIKTILSPGTKMKFHKKQLRWRVLAQAGERKWGKNSNAHLHVSSQPIVTRTVSWGREYDWKSL